MATLYRNYPGNRLLRVRLTLSDENGTIDVEKQEYLQKLEQAIPSWSEYLDSLQQEGVDDDIISELETKRLLDRFLLSKFLLR